MMLLVIRGWQFAVGRRYLLAGVAATLCAYAARQDNAGDAILMLSVFVVGVYAFLKESRQATVAPFPETAAPVALDGIQISK
jgi:hypothetical protein